MKIRRQKTSYGTYTKFVTKSFRIVIRDTRDRDEDCACEIEIKSTSKNESFFITLEYGKTPLKALQTAIKEVREIKQILTNNLK